MHSLAPLYTTHRKYDLADVSVWRKDRRLNNTSASVMTEMSGYGATLAEQKFGWSFQERAQPTVPRVALPFARISRLSTIKPVAEVPTAGL